MSTDAEQADSRDDADQEDHERGSTPGPLEDTIERAMDRTLTEGAQRLGRTWRQVLVTGFFGGTEVAIGVLALIAVLDATGSHLLAGIAFGIGFIALLLAHSELFTEGFLVPVLTVAAKRARGAHLLKLWAGTLVANLVGGWLIMWLLVAAFPMYDDLLVESATHFATAPFSVETFSLAVVAGMTMTLLTRMQHGTDDDMAKIVAALGVAFLLAGLQMFHSILDSLLVFGAIHTGDAPFGYADWARFMAYTVPGNMLGGLGLVTMLRVVRSKERLADERRASD